MKHHLHFAVIALVLMFGTCGTSSLQAGPVFIHAGGARVHPNRSIRVTTNDPLIPTIYPLITPGAPTVNPNKKLTDPTYLPVVPTGPPQTP